VSTAGVCPAGVRKRDSRNLGLIEIAFELRLLKKMIILIARTSTSSKFQVTQVERLAAQSIITDCKSNAPKASDPRSVASIVDQTENQELPRDCDDSQLEGSLQDERQPFPSVSYSISSNENKTQQEKGKISYDRLMYITNRLASKLMFVTNDGLFV
jgi:hypothetical protein